MLGDSISVNNLCWNAAVLKNLQNLLGPTWAKKLSVKIAKPKIKNNFFFEITKTDKNKNFHKLYKPFYFIKICVLTELWMFLNFVWYFFNKKSHFQLKQLSAIVNFWTVLNIFSFSVQRPFQDRCAIPCAHTHTGIKAFRNVINNTL